MGCSAYGCKTFCKRNCTRISYFKFPDDPEMMRRWLTYCNRAYFRPTAHHKLCSKHFSEQQFHYHRDLIRRLGVNFKYRMRLREGAVPDIPLEESWSNETLVHKPDCKYIQGLIATDPNNETLKKYQYKVNKPKIIYCDPKVQPKIYKLCDLKKKNKSKLLPMKVVQGFVKLGEK